MNNMIVSKEIHSVGSRSCYDGDFVELAVEGAKELEILCPLSKSTGFPLNMQSAIFMITDKNERLADVLFQEIPTIKADDSVSDADKFKLLVSRLDSGSFAENDKVAEILGNVAKEFFPEASADEIDKVVSQAQGKISFAPSDGSSE